MTCIQQLRGESSHSNSFLHLLARFPPQIVQEAARRTKSQLLTGTSLSSWVQHEATITARSSQQFFDLILKGFFLLVHIFRSFLNKLLCSRSARPIVRVHLRIPRGRRR